MPEYPECEKLRRLGETHRHLMHFLEWCDEQRIELARLTEGAHRAHLDPIMERHEQIIFRYLGIDPKKLEQERRAMLEAIDG